MKKYIIFISALIALVSCVQGPEAQHDASQRAVSLEAITTKTTYVGEKIVWESGDKVKVFFHHQDNSVYATEFSSNIKAGQTSEKAQFSGNIHTDVTVKNSYNDFGYAVYPHTAAFDAGVLKYNLPSEQNANESGSFQSGINLSSSVVDLSDLNEKGSAKAHFRNALAFVKIQLSEDVKSVTLTGTAPLSGTAPLAIGSDPETANEYGRLRVVEGEWGSKSVTLYPPVGKSFEKKDYTVLIWPGEHQSLTVSMTFNELGEYGKTSDFTSLGGFAFSSNKTYRLSLRNTEELVIEEILNGVDMPEVDSDLAAEIEALLSQVQSVSLMTEYLDNAAYARYSKFGSTNVKQDIELSYMVRPVEIAEKLVEKYSEALSAVVTYPGSDEYETLPVNSATLTDGILTVAVDAEEINNDFYSGAESAKLALQISSGRSDLLSDFANLHPKIGASLDFTRTKDIPVLKGARVSIPFKYAPNGESYTLSSPNERERRVQIVNHQGLYSGVVNVNISDSDLASQSVTVVLTSGGEVIEEVLTFADAGKFDISYLSTVDYVGGEVNVFVDKSESYGAYTMTLSNNSIGTDYESLVGKYVKTLTYYNTWIYEKNSGVQGTYFIDENGPTKATVTGPEGTDIQLEVNNEGRNQRTVNLNFEVKNANPAVNGDLTYTRSISITQKAYNTGFNDDLYYESGTVLTLKTATSSTWKKLNLFILGDGYKKSHLMKTGTFEGRARSAADVFLNAIDEDFRDRFNVYVIMRESSNSGVASGDMNGQRYTYYETFWNGSSVGISATGKENVKNDVKRKCTEASFDYYRSVAIVLMNSDADRGASDYEIDKTSTSNVGDGYASFGYTMVPANSMATNGLIKHEGVGHCLGRLGDEYPTEHHTVSLVNERHGYGFYRNIATDKNYWSAFRDAGYTADEVDYVNYFDEKGNVVKEGIYRSTNDSGIMFNNNGTFNAVSRWAIYDRIRKQTEGYRDYWNDFLIWDNNNRKK